jgi:phosphoribosylformylglycinamidine synthase
MDYEKRVHETVRSIVRQGLPESVHDLSDGGLAVGLAKCGFGSKRIGARIELSSEFPSHVALFHEAPSRVLLSVADENIEAVNAIAAALAIPAPVIGETQVGSLEVQLNGDTFHASIDDLYQAWDSALERMLQG